MKLVKAHAFGNDFILVNEQDASVVDRAEFAREVCERHRGLGADGLILYRVTATGATMRLLNADGSRSEISGNGVRCLAAWLARGANAAAGTAFDIETEAGMKRLTLLEENGTRWHFRAAMGNPERVRRDTILVNDSPVTAITLRMGNPQCVVLGEVTEERLHTLAAALAVHPHFPAGTNVELAQVEEPRLVRILIWERGVGPTEASGTGACAAAVAAITYGGAARDVEVVAPGGSQRVEWLDDGVYLTGWAEVIAEARWLAAARTRDA
jgi:diaminopimelate epimerase